MLEKSDLQQIKVAVEEVVEQKLKPVHKKLNKLQKDLDITIRSFDNDHLKNRNRIEIIENHLGLTPTRLL